MAPSTTLPPLLPAPAPVAILTPAQRQASIDTELARLREDSMSDNPAALTNLLAGLTSPEKEIREAAVQALEQFGDTNAIPALQAAAASATDPKEQAELLAAADFIALPSVDFSPPATPQTAEEIAAREAEIAQFKAEKQAALQKHERGHITNSPADSSAPNQSSLPPNN
ncbi:MAG: HEAT repeat domain-containing protein [Verrucomicrobiae bacterium]